MDNNDAIDYLLSGTGEIKPGVERISKLIQALSNPHAGMKIVHIAGTNGKGSVSAYLAAILEEAGFQTGIFNSPWIHSINECIRVNGELITNQEIVEIVAEMKPLAEDTTQFEKLMALAFCHFRNRNCSYVVLEAGMGGAFDATNFISTSVVSVITKVSMDHQSFLGETLKEIAAHKAGIIKHGGVVVSAPQEPIVMAEIEKESKIKSAELIVLNPKDAIIEKLTVDGSRFQFGSDLAPFETSMLGLHQIENGCLAILASRELFKRCEVYGDCEEVEAIIRKGIARATWPGRFEIICRSPWVIVDGAHNVNGVQALLDTLACFFPNRRPKFILGILKDKDVTAMVRLIAGATDAIVTATPQNERAFPSGELSKIASNYCENVRDGGTINNAIKIMMQDRNTEDIVVICGSLYLIDQVNDEVCQYVL
ncbi:MAG: folylpolyglutamate synthase/dihydrofolate synthase family protein [Clostridia bacterium]